MIHIYYLFTHGSIIFLHSLSFTLRIFGWVSPSYYLFDISPDGIYIVLDSQVHVVDGSSQQPEFEFDAVRLELEMFSPELAEKPYVVAYNKMDLPEAYENWQLFKEKLEARGIETFCMSAVKREGTHEVICAAHKLLQKSKEANKGSQGQISTFDFFY